MRYTQEENVAREEERHRKAASADEHERWRREEMARWDREYGMKEQKIANAALREATALQRNAALISTTKRYGDTLTYVLPRMPSKSAELPTYFNTVENVFAVYEVLNNLKAKLILPLLSFSAKFVICRLTAAQMDDYDELKKFLLA